MISQSQKYIIFIMLRCKFMLSVNLRGNLIWSVLKFTNSCNHEEWDGRSKFLVSLIFQLGSTTETFRFELWTLCPI